MVRLLRSWKGTDQLAYLWFQSHNGAIAAVARKLWEIVRALFQSHNGAIAASCSHCATSTCPMFQSHKVRLLHRKRETADGQTAMFQSHNGAIAAPTCQHSCPTQTCVSIPQWCDCCGGHWRQRCECAAFQSHNGAIAAYYHLPISVVGRRFNPTMVRLLQPVNVNGKLRLPCFNPTMVRLLRASPNSSATSKSRFQSHNGAIAAVNDNVKWRRRTLVSIPQWCDCCVGKKEANMGWKLVSIPQWCDCCDEGTKQELRLKTFQSHNGAIAAGFFYLSSARQGRVSIPQWCDCCFADIVDGQPRAIVSIPQWCDCCLCPVGNAVDTFCWFQSHNGAIAACHFTRTNLLGFIVSIPQWCDCCHTRGRGRFSLQVCFNPTMVRLLRFCCHSIRASQHGFNPTMVRLLHAEVDF